MQPSAQANQLVRTGWAMMDAGNYPAAVREFRSALSLRPEAFNALEGLGHAQLRLKQLNAAKETARSLAAVAPERSAPHMLRAQVLRLQRKPHEALKAVEEAVRLDHADAYVHLMKSWVLNDLQRWDEALGSAYKAQRFNPHDAKIAAQIAELTLVMKGARAGRLMAEAALHIDPENPEAQAALAHAAILDKDLKTAREAMASVLARDPNDESAVKVYLLTDPKKYALLREKVRFRYWCYRHRVLGKLAAMGWLLFFLVGGVAIARGLQAPGLLGMFGYLMLQRHQYETHRKAVKAHFAKPGLKRGF